MPDELIENNIKSDQSQINIFCRKENIMLVCLRTFIPFGRQRNEFNKFNVNFSSHSFLLLSFETANTNSQS